MRVDNKDTFQPMKRIFSASIIWYGKYDLDSQCLAECRLMRGEDPFGNDSDPTRLREEIREE